VVLDGLAACRWGRFCYRLPYICHDPFGRRGLGRARVTDWKKRIHILVPHLSPVVVQNALCSLPTATLSSPVRFPRVVLLGPTLLRHSFAFLTASIGLLPGGEAAASVDVDADALVLLLTWEPSSKSGNEIDPAETWRGYGWSEALAVRTVLVCPLVLELLRAAQARGVCVFLGLDSHPKRLLSCLEAVVQGRDFCTPDLTPFLVNSRRALNHPHKDTRLAAECKRSPGFLTLREQEVASLAAGGLSNAEIAATLFVEVTTVKTHVSEVLRKLRLSRRSQIAAALPTSNS